MEKLYGIKYYDSLASFLFKKTKEEHAKDAVDNLIIVEHEGKYIFSFIDRLLLVTTSYFTPEQAEEVLGFNIEKAAKSKRNRRIDEMQLHLLYDYCAQNNMLCYVYDILTEKIKEF